MEMIASTTERVPKHTSDYRNEQIEERTEKSILCTAAGGRAAVERRIAELNQEWDVERALEANAAVAALLGVLLGDRESQMVCVSGPRGRFFVATCGPRLVPAGARPAVARLPHAAGDRARTVCVKGAAGRFPRPARKRRSLGGRGSDQGREALGQPRSDAALQKAKRATNRHVRDTSCRGALAKRLFRQSEPLICAGSVPRVPLGWFHSAVRWYRATPCRQNWANYPC